ncbi:hypothetical protein PsorP6_018119 [Peronosclerospora sorghi]|uniref:Uncharacterized protein n=1 Tax=Peronosclerospora sorghi TaxID=230839 RepID=A0ACC0WDN4_9STRA|nr:hypothetical protein PsorP6_018119 [Peronosclerospora sorghi]
MTARCSSRVRRKPTPIYQVEDTRVSNEEVEEEVGASDELLTNGQGDDSSDSGPDRDDEEFKPSKSKIARSKDTRSTPRTPGTKVPKVNTHRRKRSPWSQARSVKSADRPKKRSKRSAPTEDNEDVLTSGNDDTRDVSLYESIKSGKASLEKVLTKWRGRFEEDDEAAMREVLNVVMQAFGSNQCVPDTEPLAQLDMGEMVNHVLEDLESGNGEYLLMSRGRSMKKCQQNFEEFWDVFVMECYESEILFTSNVASNFVDWLTTLSSSELRPIRHTATVAVLAMSNALVHVAASISNQLAISTRQLSAEISSPSAGKNSTNLQKMAVLKDIKALSEDRLEQVLKLVNLIFTGVVVHRYRDVMPEIRAVSMQSLGHWIITLPDHFLKDNFVKYLGWLLSDKSALVRLEVVEILCELYENDAFTERLELFNSRFMPRFLELCNDVDAAVVEASIHLLIAADKHSLISSDVDLSPVEKLVFDAQRENIRRAAAEFVCLQYDAFGVAVSKTKSAQLKKEQLNTQAIALTEFAEEYINNHDVPESAVETLVDAFWGLDDCRKLKIP